MNLLPWRAQVRKKQIQYLIIQWSILFLILMTIFAFFTWQRQHISEKLNETQRSIILLKSQLNLARSEVQELRQYSVKQQKFIGLSNKKIDEILNFLPFFPLKRGELQKVIFDINNFSIKGFALSQQEFNQIEHFLKQATNIQQYKLIHFNPTTKKIFFEFNIKFKGEKNE